MSESARAGTRIGLRYFEDALAVEFARIAHRRTLRPEGLRRTPVSLNRPPEFGPFEDNCATAAAEAAEGPNRRRAPDHKALLARAKGFAAAITEGRKPVLGPHVDAAAPDENKQRPLPVPCDATGLALSGGGIRSSALGLGVLQAFYARGRLGSFDYISTVSGGGYIGASLTAGLAKSGLPAAEESPFGDGVADSPAVGHLRDYSNYLFPRERSALRNWTDVIAILLRGLVANAVPVSATLLLLALVTAFAFPSFEVLLKGSYLPSLVDRMTGLAERWLPFRIVSLNAIVGHRQFAFTLVLLGLLAVVLVAWALARSASARSAAWSDANSRALQVAGAMVGLVAVSAFLDLQPIAIHALASVLGFLGANPPPPETRLESVLVWAFRPFELINKLGGGFSFAAIAAALSTAAHVFRTLLAETQNAKGWMGASAKVLAQTALVVVAAMIVPLALWGAYLYLAVTIIEGWTWFPLLHGAAPYVVCIVLIVGLFRLNANAYSLLRFYRDRLSRAFLFWFPAAGNQGVCYLDDLKLSELKTSAGPYPVINSALNVEGSKMANKRGRNADFFTFTPDFVGSDLTLFASTQDDGDGRPGMEAVEPALNLATAMAISGAAVSANMGSSTLRALTPTLALLNVRLGYWVRNPRDLAKNPLGGGALKKARQFIASRLWLLVEAFGLLDENSPHIYLTDGGHIENLGIYELLKRGCKLIVAIDAEADPDMSFGSLQIVERYARIDFGVRLNLPWEPIASKTRAVDQALEAGSIEPSPGPHCAIGRILYADGAQGLLLYFKASVTGDEKDYILDYKRRNPSFPHETTTDQFFTEEQFEAYRALGFHMVDHFFTGEDDFCWLKDGEGGFEMPADAFAAIDDELAAYPRPADRTTAPSGRRR